jgi:hypothetical protein
MRRLGSALSVALLLSFGAPAFAFDAEQGEKFYSVEGSYGGDVFVPHPAEWREGRLYLVPQSLQAEHAAAAAHNAETLRHDDEFVARFGKVVTKIEVKNDTWLVHGDRPGVPLDSLDKKPRKRAREEMEEALKLGQGKLGPLSEDPSLFRFHHDGRIKSWVAMPPAPRGEKTNFSLVRPIGEGANSRAYEVQSSDDDSLRVIKVLKPWAPRRFPSTANPKMLARLADEQEFISEALQNDSEFKERFGQIIPKTRSIAPGVIAQEMAKGIPFDQLSSSEKDKAREELEALVKIAKRIAPGVVFSPRTQNYLFHHDGRLKGAYDLISDGHKAYNKRGLSERDFAHLKK